MIGTLIVIILGYKRWSATEAGARTLDRWVLKLPMVSYFSKHKAVVQFCQTLGMLMESGVNLAQALDIVCNIVENKELVGKLQRRVTILLKRVK